MFGERDKDGGGGRAIARRKQTERERDGLESKAKNVYELIYEKLKCNCIFVYPVVRVSKAFGRFVRFFAFNFELVITFCCLKNQEHMCVLLLACVCVCVCDVRQAKDTFESLDGLWFRWMYLSCRTVSPAHYEALNSGNGSASSSTRESRLRPARRSRQNQQTKNDKWNVYIRDCKSELKSHKVRAARHFARMES